MAAENLATSPTSDSLNSVSEAVEFGAALRDMRLAHNTDLATVAATLRIRLVYLQAIEDGRFNDLPGPTYAAGFVRAYAEYLGLDLSEVMRRYREVALGSDRQAPLVAPSPVVEGTLPTGFILLVAAVLAAVAYGSWYYFTLHGRDVGEVVAQIPQQIAEIVGIDPSSPEVAGASPDGETTPETMESPAVTGEVQPEQPAEAAPSVEDAAPAVVAPEPQSQEAPAATAQSETPEAPVERTTEIGTGDTVAAGDSPAADQEPPAVSPAAASAGDGPPEQPQAVEMSTSRQPVTPSADEGLISGEGQTAALPAPPPAAVAGPASRVMLRATAISWVELRDSNGKRVFSRLLKKGETYNVPDNSGITLATGNAGALDIVVDGETLGPLGPIGAVRRDVLMEPASLIQRSNAQR